MQQRLSWPDISRGLSIIGVVLLHVTMAVPDGAKTVLYGINGMFAPLRMPLFFVVAGFFAVKVKNMSLMQLFTKRLWFLLVPFVVFSPIEAWLKRAELNYALDKEFPEFKEYVQAVLTGQGMYWFLHALIGFTLILWLSKFLTRWARWSLLGLAVVGPGILASGLMVTHFPDIAALPYHPYLPFLVKYLCYLPPFLLGAYLRPAIATFAEQAFHPFAMFLAAVTFWMGYTLLSAAPGPWKDTTNTMASLLFLPTAVWCAVLIGYIPVIGRGVRFIGRHTIEVYIGHQLALTAVFGFFFRYREEGISLVAENVVDTTAFWVMVCIPIAFAGGLVIYAIEKVPVIGWSVKPPAIAPLADAAKTRVRTLLFAPAQDALASPAWDPSTRRDT
ncbi:acyltransferase family protein [Corynebacterium sp. SCR221107]|uniref:acyltransferase family protein n=1 Tax=Corynebacterium sp. SCR221107 TaxID=3017361 RepID=UPI0022EC70AD|nr:acyltransferase family protein [Corynebacterium sp. SCR221107]WBT08030.1 acyltransferase family protein [Corynebacterium sp. SCR221107]